ncbi:flavodoxin domain-containing protein [Carboxylicivirga sediminis]|uniref:assimilatory sulfite reductase (NADPH) n=1 Tax=Carboxylicivirga sediminis TaxID=2006564 RepID=A0A941F0C0_9BACT|nr:flavodoxin domain-containing protein [Carboxylicivirga sediminis]MBR8534234.1 flavodoxin domain-containing protein [Carboxylicivirga sediminis]
MSQHIITGVLSESLLGEANHLVNKLSKEQLLWLGGYLSGIGLNGQQDTAVAYQQEVTNGTGIKDNQTSTANLKVLVGSHSGNGKLIARQLAEKAKSNGLQLEVSSMGDFRPKHLQKEDNVIFIVSTHGEGEPPVEAADLHKFLGGKRVGNISQLNYAVVALGDSSYQFFCQTGVDFHNRLKAHGANALSEPLLLDVDFKDQLDNLPDTVLALFGNLKSSSSDTGISAVGAHTISDGLVEAELIDKVLLNGRGSNKETYHIELDIEGTGLSYQPGDALEVYAVNDDELVQQLLTRLNYSGDEPVEHKGTTYTISELLKFHKEITVVTIPVLKKLSAFVKEPDLNRLLDKRDELDSFLYGSDLLDVLSDFSLSVQPQELADTLRTLPPRAYSIASSQAEVGDEVHLTVGAVRYEKNERPHQGVCSTFLIDQLEEGAKVAVQIKSNEGFRLPTNETDIILIGAGTGIAPYRAFLQEREAAEAIGKNWLFFGDQHFETDFLYQAEWLKYRQKGLLSKVDVAFSRDQQEKVYVQHRIKAQADEVYEWLQNGATIYVCGDRKTLARDVQQAFIEILQEQENISFEQAQERLLQLKKEGRYQEDVY